jgi:hypothetical protein
MRWDTLRLAATIAAVAKSGAPYVSPIVLHLRPGAREWWQAWLRREHAAIDMPPRATRPPPTQLSFL